MEQFPKPLQVYLVEDSAILAQLLERTVHAAGGELVGRTGDANAAIAALARHPADLVVLDIILASGSGFDVLKALAEPGPAHDALKLVLTNFATPEHRTECFKLGADCFFDKSTEAWQAIEVINRLAIYWPTFSAQKPGAGWLCPGRGPPR